MFISTPESRQKMSLALKGKTPWNKLSSPRTVCIVCGKGKAEKSKRPYCKPCRNIYEREHYNRVADRDRHLRYWYGVEDGWYEDIYSRQNGCCAICKEPKRVLCVDHNHNTGIVRELLCQHCNIIVGKIEHPLYSKALEYVEKHNGNKG